MHKASNYMLYVTAVCICLKKHDRGTTACMHHFLNVSYVNDGANTTDNQGGCHKICRSHTTSSVKSLLGRLGAILDSSASYNLQLRDRLAYTQ